VVKEKRQCIKVCKVSWNSDYFCVISLQCAF